MKKTRAKQQAIKVLDKITLIDTLDARVNKTTVLNEIAKIAFTDKTNIFKVKNGVLSIKDFNKLTEDEKACIASIKSTKSGIEITFYNKEKALESLARHLGLYEKNSSLTTTSDGKDEHIMLSDNEIC